MFTRDKNTRDGCKIVRSLGAGKNTEWCPEEANGSSGGILLFWDKRTFELLCMKENSEIET